MTSRNWNLIDIFRADARCEKCHAKLRWVFLLQQDAEFICAGSECVKALTYLCDPDAAIRALVGKWRTRRSYVYKRIHGECWSIGLNAKMGRWWVGHSPSVSDTRVFIPGSFKTVEDAKAAAVRLATTRIAS